MVLRKKIILIFVLVVLLLSSVSSSRALEVIRQENEMISHAAPDFELPDLEGQIFKMSDLKGKKTILFFWTTWCPHCVSQIRAIHEETERLRSKGLSLALINVGERESSVKEFMSSRRLSWPVLLDRHSQVARSYMVLGVPTFVLIDEKGVIAGISHNFPEEF